MIINADNYNQFALDNFKVIPYDIRFTHDEKLSDEEQCLTKSDFNLAFHSEEARSAKNVIYIWRTKSNISRLKGESNIIYVGQTSKSLYTRHGSSKVKVESEANKQKYNDIVRLYGAITVSYIELKTFDNSKKASLLKAEGQFLWWYFKNHSEYPPNNYTKTKNRNAEVEVLL